MSNLTRNKAKSICQKSVNPGQASILSFFQKRTKSTEAPIESANFKSSIVPSITSVSRRTRLSLKKHKSSEGIRRKNDKLDNSVSDTDDDDVIMIGEVNINNNALPSANTRFSTPVSQAGKRRGEISRNSKTVDSKDQAYSTLSIESDDSGKSQSFGGLTVVSTNTPAFKSKGEDIHQHRDPTPINNKVETDSATEDIVQTYYHKHFTQILETVFQDEETNNLFNDYDKNSITAFKNLTVPAQNLYIRIFQRKLKWLRASSIKYPEIAEDLSLSLEELVSSGLLQNENELSDMESALKLLPVTEIKILSKHFGIGANAKGKKQTIDAFLLHCQQQGQINRFFQASSIDHKILQKIKELSGRCYKLQHEPRKVFARLLMLFSLSGLAEDEEDSASGGQQKNLLTMLMVNKGDLTFPEYEIVKNIPIFLDRDSLIRYENAKQLEIDTLNCLNSKCLDKAHELYMKARDLFNTAQTSGEIEKESKRPDFLRRFTSSYVYVRCMNHGVDILQRLKQYQEAVDLLWVLLYQKLFCQHYRGHWWDRLTLILDFHLKFPKLTLTALRQALSDRTLRPAHEYTLRTRANKVIESMRKQQEAKEDVIIGKKVKSHRQQEDIYVVLSALENGLHVQEAPKVTILGRLLPNNPVGSKSMFVLPSYDLSSSEGDVTLLSVEELALDHYKQEGYTQGIHGEGSTVVSLFCLLFWNLIYGGSVSDVFRGPYQAWPLDLNTDLFYANRSSKMDSLIRKIRLASEKELEEEVGLSWENHVGVTSLVSWDLFTGPDQVKDLVRCFKSESLARICEILAKDFRHFRSGFPDLVVWNPESGHLKVVEVKGPKDRLSSKQVIWLHFLLEMNVSAEVCYINAVSGKKLKLEK